MFSLANLLRPEESFYLFLEHLSDAVIYVSGNLKMQHSNTAAGKLLDHQSRAFLVNLCEKHREYLLQKGCWSETLDCVLESGKLLRIDINITVLMEHSHSVGFIITCKNVSELANPFLPYFEAFMRYLPALAWITDEQFTLQYFNENFKNTFNVANDQFGCSVDQILPPALMAEYKKHNDSVFTSHSLQYTIEEGFDGKGGKCAFKVCRFPLNVSDHQKLLGVIAIDITTQMQQQQELVASNERFLYINKATSDAIWDWDIATDNVYRGEGYFKLSETDTDKVSMRQHFQFIHLKDRKKVMKSLEAALAQHEDIWQEEYSFLCKDGTYHDIIDKGYIVRNKLGAPIRMIGAMKDVSQNRRLEKVLIEKEEAKKKEIIKAIIEAQEKERTQISYDLHEQLSQNLATCKLLLDGLHFPETKEEETIRLRSSMKLLTQTMNEIRSMSHQLNANAIKMVGLIGVMRDLTSTVNQNWQVEVQLHCNGFSDTTILPKEIEVSAFRIFQEVMNNIIRHSGATLATVQLSKKNKWLVLSIRDNGKGFDVDSTPKGLGFTNIINRVDYHNGTVSIISSEGNGCTLEVKLPIGGNNELP